MRLSKFRLALIFLSLNLSCGASWGANNLATPTMTPAVPMTTKSFSISNDPGLLNPERGFMVFTDLLQDKSRYPKIRAAGRTLVYGAVHLDSFRNTPLSGKILADIDAAFAVARSSGIKVIPRFVYNDSVAPDAPKAIVLQHISQLKPLLQKNADVIYTLQAGFIGNWGEWWGSSNGLDTTANERDILYAILDALPQGRTVAIRTPKYKANILGSNTPLTLAQAYSGSHQSRIGHVNDCFLASKTDEGTYPSNAIETWKNYVATDGLYTPVGGETCAVNPPRSDCPTATAEMARLHWSYLNDGYHPKVIARFKSQGCFDTIRRDLGYRFALSSASYTSTPQAGSPMTLAVDLKNLGYAAMFNARPVFVVLKNATTRFIFEITNASGANPRYWQAGTNQHFEATFTLPATMPKGSYTLSLWLPDAAATLRANPNYAVQFSNLNTWDASSGENIIDKVIVN